MKILVDGTIFDSYPRGGIARLFREVMRRACELREDIQFCIFCEEHALAHVPRHERIFIVLRPKLRWSRLPFKGRRFAWQVRRYIQALVAFEADLFHSTFYSTCPVPNVASVATVYDLIDWEFRFFCPNGPAFVDRQKQVLTNASLVVSISKATAELAMRAFQLDEQKMRVVHLAASDVFRPAEDSVGIDFRSTYTSGKPYFLFVGATTPYKNLSTLLRAFALSGMRDDYRLVLAGHSMQHADDWYNELVIETGIERSVTKLFDPSDELLRAAYCGASAFVFPSLQEGFGIPLLEAMQCLTPIIASDIPVFREVCGDAACYFDPHSASALAEKLLACRNNGRLPSRNTVAAARNGPRSWDATTCELINVYSEALQL